MRIKMFVFHVFIVIAAAQFSSLLLGFSEGGDTPIKVMSTAIWMLMAFCFLNLMMEFPEQVWKWWKIHLKLVKIQDVYPPWVGAHKKQGTLLLLEVTLIVGTFGLVKLMQAFTASNAIEGEMIKNAMWIAFLAGFGKAYIKRRYHHLTHAT
jgi:hypothetical protein